MSTSPHEVHNRRKRGASGALAFCLVMLGMVGSRAWAVDPLTLVSTSPTHNQLNVPLDAPIVLTFNGPVDPNQANLLSSNGQGNPHIQVVPSTGANGNPLGLGIAFSNNNTVVTLTHSNPFAQQTSYVVRLEGLKSADATKAISTPDNQLVAVGSSAVNPFTFRSFDNLPPYVSNHSPGNNTAAGSLAGSLATNGSVQVNFDEPMDVASVVANTTVVATKFDGTTVDLKPRLDFVFDVTNTTLTIRLKANQDFKDIASKSADLISRVTVTVGGTDVVGLALVNNPNPDGTNQNPFTFPVADAIPPALVSFNPQNSTGAAQGFDQVVFRFDEAVSCGAIITQSVGGAAATIVVYTGPVTASGTAIPTNQILPGNYTVACSDNNKTVTLTSSNPFSINSTINVRINGPVTGGANTLHDAQGIFIAGNIDNQFSTTTQFAPTIQSTNPLDQSGINQALNANRIDPNTPITINFSSAINPATFTAELRNAATNALIATTVSFSNSNLTVTLTPTAPLEAGNNSVFVAKITNAEGTTGQKLIPSQVAPNNTITFRVQDLTGPSISTLNPPNGAQLEPDDLIPNPQPPNSSANPADTIVVGLNEAIQGSTNATPSQGVAEPNLPIIEITYSRAPDDPRPIPPMPILDPASSFQGGAPLSLTTNRVLYQVSPAAIANANSASPTLNLLFDKTMEEDLNGNIVNNGTVQTTDPLFPPQSWAFPPGETVIIRLIQAKDLNGNNALQNTTTPQPNPFIYSVIDVRPPKVTRVRVGGVTIDGSTQTVNGVKVPTASNNQHSAGLTAGANIPPSDPNPYPLVALAAPVEVTFSKPMSTLPTTVPGTGPGRLVFKADGNYCGSADLVLADNAGNVTQVLAGPGVQANGGVGAPPADGCTAINNYAAVAGINFNNANSPNFWRARGSAYSTDLRTVTLTHVPFPEANPNDVNVEDRNAPDTVVHFFQIMQALDQATPPNDLLRDALESQSGPAGSVRTATGIPDLSQFETSSQPRVTDIEYEVAADNATNTLTDVGADGLLAGSNDPNVLPFGTGPRRPMLLEPITLDPSDLYAKIPLNSRFRFSFNGVINQTSVAPPQFGLVQTQLGARPITGWSVIFNAASDEAIFSHSDLLSGVNQPYSRTALDNTMIAPAASVYQNFQLGNASDIKGDPLFVPNAQTTPAQQGASVGPVQVSGIDVTPPAMTVEYISNINRNGKFCKNGTESTSLADAVWVPLTNGAVIPVTTRFRIRLNETFGPGAPASDTSIALNISANTANNNQAIGSTNFLNADLTSLNVHKRQDYTPGGGIPVVGGQTVFSLTGTQSNPTPGELASSTAGGPNGGRSQANYSLTFTAGDTRLTDLGAPYQQTGGVSVAGVFGNQVIQSYTFSTQDVTPATVRTISGSPSNLTTFGPSDNIVVKFDSAVNIDTVDLKNTSKPTNAPDPTFTKAYGDNGNDKTTVVFTPATPLIQPASGAPNVYQFQVIPKAGLTTPGVAAIPAAGLATCNPVAVQNDPNVLNPASANNGNTAGAAFIVRIPKESVPPTVRSFTATQEELTIQFSEPVTNGDPAANGGNNSSVLNTQNFQAPINATSGNTPPAATPASGAGQNLGSVNYVFFNPNRTSLVNGALVLDPGIVVVNKKILNIRYNADAATAVLQVEPLTEGDATKATPTVFVNILGNIQDLNANALVGVNLSTTVQTGRADWLIRLSAVSNVPGASPDTDNRFGVLGIEGQGGAASIGLDDQDIPEPIAPGANHVFVYSSRGRDEQGFQGSGGNFTADIQSRPQIGTAPADNIGCSDPAIVNTSVRCWPRIGVTTDLGVTTPPGQPSGAATITLSWNLSVPGQEVPRTYAVELINLQPAAGEPTSIDMTSQNSFSYSVTNNGLDVTKQFQLRVTAPSVFQAPFLLGDGFNEIGVPVKTQNSAVGNVFFGLSPLVVYRYDPTTGYEIFPGSSFQNVEPGRGYFVRPRVAGYQLKVLGVPVVGQTTLSLKKGWNLISDPFTVPVNGANMQVKSGNDTLSVSDAVKRALLQDSAVTFDPATRGYTAPQSLSTGTLQPWRGYWVLAFQDVTLVVNKPTPTTP